MAPSSPEQSIFALLTDRLLIFGTVALAFYPVAILLYQVYRISFTRRTAAAKARTPDDVKPKVETKFPAHSTGVRSGVMAIVAMAALATLVALSCLLLALSAAQAGGAAGVVGTLVLAVLLPKTLGYMGRSGTPQARPGQDGGRCSGQWAATVQPLSAASLPHDAMGRIFEEVVYFFGRAAIWLVNFSFAIFWVPYCYAYWLRARGAMSFDGCYIWEGVRLTRQVRYSNKYRIETFDVIEPETAAAAAADRTPIVYVHGGAFVAVNSELELHSLSFLVREGFTVYSVDYPLAPAHAFPEAAFSVLRALAFLRSTYGLERVVLAGDSAGGSLVTMVAALLHNTPLMRKFQAATGEPLLDMQFPRVETLVCLYGILDQNASLVDRSLPFRAAMRFIYRCYAPPTRSPFEGRFTLVDFIDDVERYPKTLLIGGEADPIFRSTLAGHAALRERGFDCILKSYPATHAFLGFPFSWPTPQNFRQSCVDCMRDFSAFLNGVPAKEHEATIPRLPLYERLFGFLEAGTLTGVVPMLTYALFGRAGAAALALLYAAVSAVGFVAFYWKHSKWPEHW
mmetsp:Transcript_9151/g.23934  ORF Transcript_9151/g.23934 Transcript_9151/m.23934 type:complete len:568 (-) Transcript_9151:124-1827(-)